MIKGVNRTSKKKIVRTKLLNFSGLTGTKPD